VIARLMGLKTISPEALHRLMQSEPVTAIDVNSRDSWLRARVPRSRHLDPAAFSHGDLPENRDAALVFYCSGPMCRKAPNAAKRAEQMGYRNVRVMSAGISGWVGATLPTEAGDGAA
jgi:rhodanese-related sulfurtransferase